MIDGHCLSGWISKGFFTLDRPSVYSSQDVDDTSLGGILVKTSNFYGDSERWIDSVSTNSIKRLIVLPTRPKVNNRAILD